MDTLIHIPSYYQRHGDGLLRFVSNMVASAVRSKVNRSPDDPLFLAQEVARSNLRADNVRGIIRLYKQRVMSTPSLQLKPSLEECTVRLLDPAKVCVAAKRVLVQITQQYTWQDGPLTSNTLLAPKFVIGARSLDTMNEVWGALGTQTAAGQTYALECVRAQAAAEVAGSGGEVAGIKKWKQGAFDELCATSAFWLALKEHVVPAMMLPPAAVDDLCRQFKNGASKGLAEALTSLMLADPPELFTDYAATVPYVLQNVPELRVAKEKQVADARKPSEDHPDTIMNKQEMAQLTSGLYFGQVTLDAAHYREAMEKLKESTEEHERERVHVRDRHVADVKAVQDEMQLSDITFSCPSLDRSQKKGPGCDWVQKAVFSALDNQRRVLALTRAKQEDVAVLNIFSLHSLGTIKKMVVDKITETALPVLHGLTLVFYPVLPTQVHKTTRCSPNKRPACGGDASELAEPSPSACGDDSDEDPEVNSFTVDGSLPEALTEANAKMTHRQRAASLARDFFLVDKALGQADIERRYPKQVQITHTPDATGYKDVNRAMLIIPVDDSGLTGLEDTTLMRDGVYVDVPAPTAFTNVSRKAAFLAKRSQQTGWETQGNAVRCASYVHNKSARGQLGEEVFAWVLKDCVSKCSRPVLLVNDFVAGCGEVGVAAMDVKVSQEALSANVRLMYWGHEPRKMWGEVARAGIRTTVGQQYLSGALKRPGRTPVLAPAATDGPSKRRKTVKDFLAAPLQHLSLDAAGGLVLPTDAALSSMAPAPLTKEITDLFARLREPYTAPAPATGSPAVSVPPPAATGPDPPDPAAGSTSISTPPGPAPVPAGAVVSPDPMGAGSVFTNRDECAQACTGLKFLKEAPLPLSSCKDFILVLAQSTNAFHILLEKHGKSSIQNRCWHLRGPGGGAGQFRSLDTRPLEEKDQAYAWRYTRIHEWKKETGGRTNGCLVYAATRPNNDPKLETLEAIEAKLGSMPQPLGLYAHTITRGAKALRVAPGPTKVAWCPFRAEPLDGSTFQADTLGQWLRADDPPDPPRGSKAGLRPAFEVSLKASTLGPLPDVAANPLCLFTRRAVTLKTHGLVVLG